MREKIKAKNLKYKFYRFDKEKNIELFTNGGWHFNNLLSPENISKKLKTFAHTEYSDDKFSSIEIIKKKSLIKLIYLKEEKIMKNKKLIRISKIFKR